MTLTFKPMLSADVSDVDLATLSYPLVASPKLDGVRAIIWEGVAYSRNAKPIRNHFVQAWARDLHNLDGELIVGSATEGNVLGRTQSGVMSFAGMPDFSFHLFDCIRDDPFRRRLNAVTNSYSHNPRIVPVPHAEIINAGHLREYEASMLAEGYEGVMLRDAMGPYKHGRSTLREGYLMKLKQFTDGEAVVVGLEEGSVNGNELERDELGRAKRSKVSSGLTPSGMIGTLLVKDPKWGDLRVAPGTMTHQERRFWLNDTTAHGLIGKTIHWRSFGYGMKDKPRFPRFYGIREDV